MADRLITGLGGAFWLDETADRLITGFHSAAYDTAAGSAASVSVPDAALAYTLHAPTVSGAQVASVSVPDASLAYTLNAPTVTAIATVVFPVALLVNRRSPLLRF